jgi:DNA-binding MarR family transcriptional regulator
VVYDQVMAPTGLRITQYSMLAAVHRLGGEAGLPVSELADLMDMDRTTLTRNLKPVVDQGFASVVADAQDARVRRACITAEGRAALAAARPHWQRAQKEVNQTLGEANVAALHDWLDQVTPAFRPPTSHAGGEV